MTFNGPLSIIKQLYSDEDMKVFMAEQMMAFEKRKLEGSHDQSRQVEGKFQTKNGWNSK